MVTTSFSWFPLQKVYAPHGDSGVCTEPLELGVPGHQVVGLR